MYGAGARADLSGAHVGFSMAADHTRCARVRVLRACRRQEKEKTSMMIEALKSDGSRAVPGFMKPEGVVVYHKAGGVMFKATCERDEEWKGKRDGA